MAYVTKKRNDGKGILYLLYSRNQNLYKIGITRDDVQKRLSSLLTADPSIICIKQTKRIAGYDKIEKMLHDQYKPANTQREWFRLGPNQVGNIKEFYDDLSREKRRGK